MSIRNIHSNRVICSCNVLELFVDDSQNVGLLRNKLKSNRRNTHMYDFFYGVQTSEQQSCYFSTLIFIIGSISDLA